MAKQFYQCSTPTDNVKDINDLGEALVHDESLVTRSQPRTDISYPIADFNGSKTLIQAAIFTADKQNTEQVDYWHWIEVIQ